jgi:FkbM family methyltransferase
MNRTLFAPGGRAITFVDLETTDWVQERIAGGMFYEQKNLEYIRSLNIKGNYADIGAYVGNHTLFFAFMCPSEKIYCWEPQADIFQKLKRNVEVNGLQNKCVLHNSGIWSERTFIVSSRPADPRNRGGQPFMVADNRQAGIQADTLDSYGYDITVLKIDVENNELKVLAGATETLKKVQHVFLELWSVADCRTWNAVCQIPEAITFFKDRGFEPKTFDNEDNLWHFARV